MELIGWYILFAATTGIVSFLELSLPVIRMALESRYENVVSKHKYLVSTILISMGTLLAPIIIIPCIIPGSGANFRKSLYASLVD